MVSTPTSFPNDRVTDRQSSADHHVKVAVVANSLTPYRIYLHQRLVREQPQIELWSLTTHGNAYSRWKGLEVPQEIRPVSFGHGEPTNEQTRLRFALREWRKASRILAWFTEHGVDAVICQGYGDVGRMRILRWCRRHEIPSFIMADSNIRGDVHGFPKRSLKKAIVGKAVSWATGFMPCGEYGAQLFQRYGADPDQIFPVAWIPDLELFRNTPAAALEQARSKHELDPQRRRIVFCARMMPAKRPDVAIQAFIRIAQQRPEWDLVMIGDGPLREPTAQLVPGDLGGRVRWTGLIHDMAELAGIYAQSDLMLLPSDHEPWGMVIVEAAAAGLGIISTDVVGASPELVKVGRNGALFPPGDVNRLSAELLQITEPTAIASCKEQSPVVLQELLATADPVSNICRALEWCGVAPVTKR